MMSAATSGVLSKPAPMPACTEKCLGQPMLMSTTVKSRAATSAALSALTESLAPSCSTFRPGGPLAMQYTKNVQGCLRAKF